MTISRWIWPMNLAGKIAVANLICVGFYFLLHRCLFPEGVVHVDREPAWKLAVADGLGCVRLVLTFPLGWAYTFGGPSLNDIGYVVFVPLNAYLWGWIGQAAWRRNRRSRRSLPNR